MRHQNTDLKLENKGSEIATKYRLCDTINYGREPSGRGHANGLSSRGSELCEYVSAYRLTLFSAKTKLEDLKSMATDHGLEPM
jgi:hypothetical protein